MHMMDAGENKKSLLFEKLFLDIVSYRTETELQVKLSFPGSVGYV